MNAKNTIYLYPRFERFWHWTQTLLILALLITGFEIHGTCALLGFETAFTVHNFCAWVWLILYIFILFWMTTTGEWRHYIPTFRKLYDVSCYYAYGIFRGEAHPVPKSVRIKHNPLQRLTYIGIVSVLLPYQMVTGFLYYYYNSWPRFGLDWRLGTISFLHMTGAFALLIFLVVHMYMITTGPTVMAHTRAMLTGWEEVEDVQACEWENKSKKSKCNVKNMKTV